MAAKKNTNTATWFVLFSKCYSAARPNIWNNTPSDNAIGYSDSVARVALATG